MKQDDILVSHNCYKSNSKQRWNNKRKMSRDKNKEVMVRCKKIMANLLTVQGLLVEPITAIVKPKGYIEASFSIRQTP